MITYPELDRQLRNLPTLIAQELARDSDKGNEYLWLTRTMDHLLEWSGELSLRFERFQRNIAVTDTRSVKPAQVARSLSSLQRLLEQLTRNPLLSDDERQVRRTLVMVVGKLEQCFTQGGVLSPEPTAPPPQQPATLAPRSSGDTGMLTLLYGLDTPKPAPLPLPVEPAPAEPDPVRQLSAKEKMRQAMTRALRQRQPPPTSDKDKS